MNSPYYYPQNTNNWESREYCAHCGILCRTYGYNGRFICDTCIAKGLR